MEEDNPQGVLILPWWVWVMVIVLCLPSILMGCAKPRQPYCERYQYSFATRGEKLYVVIDEANASKLAKLIQGLAEGTCTLPPPKGTEL